MLGRLGWIGNAPQLQSPVTLTRCDADGKTTGIWRKSIGPNVAEIVPWSCPEATVMVATWLSSISPRALEPLGGSRKSVANDTAGVLVVPPIVGVGKPGVG